MDMKKIYTAFKSIEGNVPVCPLTDSIQSHSICSTFILDAAFKNYRVVMGIKASSRGNLLMLLLKVRHTHTQIFLNWRASVVVLTWFEFKMFSANAASSFLLLDMKLNGKRTWNIFRDILCSCSGAGSLSKTFSANEWKIWPWVIIKGLFCMGMINQNIGC